MTRRDAQLCVTRAEVEDFLYHEAALLDDWKLDEWEALLTDDAGYYVPPNDQPDGDHRATLFLVADDRERIRQRVIRIKDPNCHAEYPQVAHPADDLERAHHRRSTATSSPSTANFVCYRFRRYERIREYVGAYRYMLRRDRRQLPDQGAPRADRRARARLARLGELYLVRKAQPLSLSCPA